MDTEEDLMKLSKSALLGVMLDALDYMNQSNSRSIYACIKLATSDENGNELSAAKLNRDYKGCY